jgi:hypothetical protein
MASGSGIVAAGESQAVRLSWDNVNVPPGTELYGAVGVGNRRESANNIGIIPVTLNVTGSSDPETLVLMNGISRGLSIPGGGMHDRAFIDVPPETVSLTVTAEGLNSGQSDDLEIELYRMDFDDAFAQAPFAMAADTSGNPLAADSGGAGAGPTVTRSGANLIAGRWYAVVKNNGAAHAEVTLRADLEFNGSPIPVQFGLWEPSSRPDIHQGVDFNSAGAYRAMLWYTFNEDGEPTWYQAAAAATDGNVFVAELLRYTNDGTLQHSAPVGYVSFTTLSETDSIFSFVLYGQAGSDRMRALASKNCPTIDESQKSYDGLWARAVVGLGGASGLVNAAAQAFVHYIYDDSGNPVWFTASPSPQSPSTTEMGILQWTGNCPVCTGNEPSSATVGTFTRVFADESNLTWTLDYDLNSPISGTIDRTDEVGKLTIDNECR